MTNVDLKNHKCALIILDGWGMPENFSSSAISPENTPFFYKLFHSFPSTQLIASGEFVGLPNKQMGNSEVGHLTIGSGRVVDQSLQRIYKSIISKDFFKIESTLNALNFAKKHNKTVHLIGLVSSGGVHSHIEHIEAMVKMAHENGNKNVFLHAITDGRDCEIDSGYNFLKRINGALNKFSYKLATIAGRFYAMDRDNRWDRTICYFNELIEENNFAENWQKNIEEQYKKGIYDEFIPPFTVSRDPNSKIKEGDVVIMCNFRADRMKQIVSLLLNKEKNIVNHELDLYLVSLTEYDKNFENVHVIFPHIEIKNSLPEILSKNGLLQHKIAETEKYAHVTYFLSGGIENNFIGETRELVPSPKVQTYDFTPKMSAEEIKNRLIERLFVGDKDFICVNFANADMVGHTGNIEATRIACNFLDTCLEEIVPIAIKNNYSLIITSDHGNAEKMLSDTGQPFTAHTTNLVPFILIDKKIKKLASKIDEPSLSDIAPTILKLLGQEIPSEISGRPLF